MNATIRTETPKPHRSPTTTLLRVSEVEAGIRDFVRNDIAYLRRRPVGRARDRPPPSPVPMPP